MAMLSSSQTVNVITMARSHLFNLARSRRVLPSAFGGPCKLTMGLVQSGALPVLCNFLASCEPMNLWILLNISTINMSYISVELQCRMNQQIGSSQKKGVKLQDHHIDRRDQRQVACRNGTPQRSRWSNSSPHRHQAFGPASCRGNTIGTDGKSPVSGNFQVLFWVETSSLSP